MRKSYGYTENAQVPLIARLPGKIPPGLVTDGLITTIDIYPTLLGLAGISAPEGTRGMDLSHLFFGAEGEDREYGLHFFCPSYDRTMEESVWGIRTQQYLYFRDKGVTHLYDRKADPYEMRNLAGNPQYAEVEAQMVKALEGRTVRLNRRATRMGAGTTRRRAA